MVVEDGYGVDKKFETYAAAAEYVAKRKAGAPALYPYVARNGTWWPDDKDEEAYKRWLAPVLRKAGYDRDFRTPRYLIDSYGEALALPPHTVSKDGFLDKEFKTRAEAEEYVAKRKSEHKAEFRYDLQFVKGVDALTVASFMARWDRAVTDFLMWAREGAEAEERKTGEGN